MEEIRYCPYCQPYDSGEIVWILGRQIELEELFDWLEVPEEQRDVISERLSCPNCGADLDRTMDVGIRFEFEREYDKKLEEALSAFEDGLWEFADYLENLPFLGASHEMGKRILEEMERFRRVTLEDVTWYRARRMVDGRILSVEELFPPDPDEVDIPGGRYNHPGKSHWYLASGSDASVAEVTISDELMAWVQGFHIGILENILDLRSWTAEDLAAEELDRIPLVAFALVFSDVLQGRKERDRHSDSVYYPSRFVADAARERGFSGILFRSVRHLEENLIIFDPRFPCAPIGAPELTTITVHEARIRDGQNLIDITRIDDEEEVKPPSEGPF
jgi:hypothetical protein